MSLHHAEIVQRMSRFLDRRSVPRALDGKQQAVADELQALVAAVARYAPRGEALRDWWPLFEARLAEGNATRAWPTEGEVRLAANDCNPPNTTGGGMAEERAVGMLIDWFGKFKDQMPGMGSPGRTAELIRRGVLADEREARFRGFDLSRDQTAQAMAQPMGADEWAQHVRIAARIKGLGENEADFGEQAALSTSQLPVRHRAQSPRAKRFGTSDGF